MAITSKVNIEKLGTGLNELIRNIEEFNTENGGVTDELRKLRNEWDDPVAHKFSGDYNEAQKKVSGLLEELHAYVEYTKRTIDHLQSTYLTNI